MSGLVLAGVGSLLLALAGEGVSYAALLPNLLLVGVGGVLGVALLGSLVAGDGGFAFVEGLHLAGVVCAVVLLTGAAISLLHVRAPARAAAPKEGAAVSTAP